MNKFILSFLLVRCCLLGNTAAFEIALETHELFSTAHWGLLLIDAKSQQVLHEYNKNQLFIPASITKLFTTAAAVEVLGANYMFETTARASTGLEAGGIIEGNLYLVGGGDPTLNSSKLKNLAQQLHAAGVRLIKGSVIVDDSLFEGITLPTHIEWEDLVSGDETPISALSISDTIFENIYMELIEDGIITFKAPHEYIRVIFTQALTDYGILCLEDYYPDSSSQAITKLSSPPLASIINKINKLSHNLSANLLYKALQKHAKNPFEILMKRIGIDDLSYLLFDGSGLSRHNLISPEHTIQLLEYIECNEVMMDSLSIGNRDGTLATRFQSQPFVIKAKTGSMSGISNLAGFIETYQGERYIFAFFINNSLWPEKETSEALDHVLLKLISI